MNEECLDKDYVSDRRLIMINVYEDDWSYIKKGMKKQSTQIKHFTPIFGINARKNIEVMEELKHHMKTDGFLLHEMSQNTENYIESVGELRRDILLTSTQMFPEFCRQLSTCKFFEFLKSVQGIELLRKLIQDEHSTIRERDGLISKEISNYLSGIKLTKHL